MYSSVVGGIILDPSMMAIPIDDHMVHRGHGVFDTANISDGSPLFLSPDTVSFPISDPEILNICLRSSRYLYELDSHLDRLLESASKAKIEPPFPREAMRDVLIQTTAASGCKNGSIKYWLSAGPGDFLVSPEGCTGPAFYAVVIPAAAAGHRRSYQYQQQQQQQQQNGDHCGGRPGGVKAITTSVPMKHPFFAGVKSVDYLPNALAAVEAEERGAHASVWVDEDGCVAEGPTMNVAFVTAAGDLVVPAFDRVLGGCTARRVLALSPRLVEAGLISSAGNARIPAGEARRCAEMMLLGSGLPVLPVVEWDGQPVGDGKLCRLQLRITALVYARSRILEWNFLQHDVDRLMVR
jgi:4-amino-4-deoxychorismate lyase